MSLIKVKPYIIDSTLDFTFNNVTATGNIVSLNANLGNAATANYFVGNGTFLTGLPASYANSNVAAYLPTFTGNLAAGNATLGNLVTANYFTGVLTTASQPNITTVGTLTNLGVTGNLVVGGNLTVNGTVTSINSTVVEIDDLALVLANDASTSSQANGAGIIINGAAANMLYINSTNSFTFSHKISADGSLLSSLAGANVTGNVGNASHAYVADAANSVAGANVTGQVGNALVAGTVYTNAQPNITSVGTLSTLTVTANVAAGNILTDHLLYSNGTAWNLGGSAVTPGGSNTYIQFNDGSSFGGNAGLVFDKTATKLTANNFAVTTSANLGAVGNVTITGGTTGQVLTTNGSGGLSWSTVSSGAAGASVTVSATAPSTPNEGDMWLDSNSGELNIYFGGGWGDVSASAGQLDIQVNNFTGDGIQSNFTLTVTPAGANYTIVTVGGVVQPRNYYSVSGATLSFGTAPPANTPIEVSIFGGSASPIGLAGTVTSAAQPNITSVGTLTSLVVGGNATVGNLKTDHLMYANGSAYVFTTNAAGSNTQVQFNNSNAFAGSANLTFNITTNTLSVTNIVATGANLGSASNLILSGGTNGQVLTSNGAGGVSWTAAPSGFTAAKAMVMGLFFGG